MRILILNWDKYNAPRKDVKNPTWFRMSNTFYESLFSCDSDTKVVFITLLAFASKKQIAEIEFDLALAQTLLKIPIQKVETSLKLLETLEMIRIVHGTRALRARHARVTLQTDRQTDIHTDSDGVTDLPPEKGRPGRKPKLRVTTFEPDDPAARVFANLLAIPKYAEIFDLENDRGVIHEHMRRHEGLRIADLEEISWQLRNWANGPAGAKMKSPRGTLATFVTKYVQRKADVPKPLESADPYFGRPRPIGVEYKR